MKQLYSLLVVLVLSLILISCTQLFGPQPTGPAAVRQAIEEAGFRFATALNQGDAAAVAALYVEDARLLAPNTPMISGRQGIQAFWQDYIHMTSSREVTLQVQKIDYNGDLAYEVGSYTLRFQLTASGSPPMTDDGKYVVVWKRQRDGSWKIAVDTWNTDLPMP
jgi:uncharacterized protein (TIGR02246 family)